MTTTTTTTAPTAATAATGSVASLEPTTYAAPTGVVALWERIGAALYDPFLTWGERRGMARRRAELLAQADGRVLEIGAGTGLNLDSYPAGLESLVLSEPVPGMAKRLRRRLNAQGLQDRAEVVEAPADVLPFPTGTFDTVVSTMVLCTVPDPASALSEIARVLRPGGRLLFIEHVHAGDTRLGRWQRRLAGAWAGFAQGCRCDRDLVAAIGAQLTLGRTHADDWAGMPALVKPLVIGSATLD